jgi:hypothetical protein
MSIDFRGVVQNPQINGIQLWRVGPLDPNTVAPTPMPSTAAPTAVPTTPAPTPVRFLSVDVVGNQIYVNGSRFFVRGVCYSP